MSDFEEVDYSKKVKLGVWGKLFRYSTRHRATIFLLVVIMVVVAVLDGIFPQMTRYAIDNLIPALTAAGAHVDPFAIGLTGFLIGYLLLALFQGFNIWALIAVAGLIEVRLVYDLRDKAFRRLQELSFSYYDRTPAGWIMARMNSDTQRLGEVIAWGIVDLVWGAALILAIIGFMLAMNWQLALITLCILPPLVLASLWFQRRILDAQRKSRKTNSIISGAFNEGLQGARTSKTLVVEDQNGADFNKLTKTMRSHSVRAAKLSSLYLPIVIFLSSTGAALALGFGGQWVLKDWLTYGTMVAFLNYAMQFFEPAREVARVLSELQAAQASAERLIGLIETEPEIQDSPEALAKYGDAINPRHENWEKIRGEVVFENVDFRYGSLPDKSAAGTMDPSLEIIEAGNENAQHPVDVAVSGKPGETSDIGNNSTGKPREAAESVAETPWVLQNFNLTIPAGQTLAVVGETGSGKSTLVNLLCRFYEPTSGRILIDGSDYRERSQHWLHSRLGYVLQTPQLFQGSIRENIRYGRLEASDAEVETAARHANAMHFIGRLEKGLDTVVGEGGVLLSTGEKQLVSLARALLADPAIMILDEATSSIDTETEVLIQQAVNRILSDRTAVVIAHRLSTIRSADRIIVMVAGKIIEDGSHDQLMQARGHYWRLYTRQFLDEEAISEAVHAG